MNNFNIKNVNHVHRETVNYNEKTITLNFESEEAFTLYKEDTLNKHATWCMYQQRKVSTYSSVNSDYASQGRFHVSTVKYRCDHAGAVKGKNKQGKRTRLLLLKKGQLSIFLRVF